MWIISVAVSVLGGSREGRSHEHRRQPISVQDFTTIFNILMSCMLACFGYASYAAFSW